MPSATPAFAIVAFAERAPRRQPAAPLPEGHLLDTLGMKAAGIAHDINNLLTIMIGCTGLVLDSCPPDDPRYELADETLQAAARTSELSRQLLAATRAMTIPAIPVDVNSVLTSAMPLLRRVAGARIELLPEPAAELGPVSMVVIDLERVIVNLVANARDAMPSGGVLRIETRAAEGDRGILIAVRDNGAGMDDETRRRMFEPFFTTKAAGRGTGLGLSIVHDIVTRAGGTIHVESAPGTGTTVNLYFPLARRVGDDGR